MKVSPVWPGALIAAASLVLASCEVDRVTEASSRVQAVPFPGGPGSAQPRMAVSADGVPVLSWLEPDGEAMVLRYATFASGAFGAPREVVRGEDLMANWADMPSVLPIGGDVWAAHWLKLDPNSPGAYHVATAVSNDRGGTWSAPVQLNDDSAAAEHGFVELFAWNNAIGAFWLDGRAHAEWSFDEPDKLLGTSLRVARLDASGAVVAREIVDELVCDCCQPDHALTSSGPVVRPAMSFPSLTETKFTLPVTGWT